MSEHGFGREDDVAIEVEDLDADAVVVAAAENADEDAMAEGVIEVDVDDVEIVDVEIMEVDVVALAADLSADAADAPPAEPAEAFEPTGDPRVDDAVARLEELAGSPTGEHVAVFEDVHRRLHDALSDLGTEA